MAIHAQETNNLKYKNQDYHQAYIPKGDDILKNNPVKNVILMIGDGMGLARILLHQEPPMQLDKKHIMELLGWI